MEEIVEIISTVGFPIAVVVYLLYERSGVTKELTKALGKLEVAIIKLEAQLNGKI